MSSRTLNPAAALVAGLLLIGTGVHAEALRLVSWNAQQLTNVADRASTREARLNSAAFHLGSQNPDIVFLQGLPDRATADELASRLGEGFAVVACSLFDESAAGNVAILSHLPSGLSWPGTWNPVGAANPNGGYVFANLKSGDDWVAVHSVSFPDSVVAAPIRESATRQLLTSIAELSEWRANRPSAYLIAGTVNTDADESVRTGEQTLSLHEAAGFTSAYLDLPRPDRLTVRAKEQYPATTADYIFADTGGFLDTATVHPSILSDHALVTVDWDINATMPVPAPVVANTAPTLADTGNELFGVHLKWWVAGLGVFVLLMLLLNLFRRPRTIYAPASRALPASSGDNILFLKDGESNTGTRHQQHAGDFLTEKERKKMRPQMMRWLKEHFVGSLVSERQDLMDSNHAAATQADELGRRVEQMQVQLMQRIDAAEGRVKELEGELAHAKNENKELIRSNLLNAQRELDEARTRMKESQG